MKKHNYRSFRYVILKIQITKKVRGVKVKEVTRNILAASNSLNTGKHVYFKKALLYSYSPVPCRHIAKNKLKDILLQDLEDHINEGPQSLQEYAIVINMIALTISILNKSSSYADSAELLVKRLLKGYGRVDIIVGCYKTKSIKSS